MATPKEAIAISRYTEVPQLPILVKWRHNDGRTDDLAPNRRRDWNQRRCATSSALVHRGPSGIRHDASAYSGGKDIDRHGQKYECQDAKNQSYQAKKR